MEKSQWRERVFSPIPFFRLELYKELKMPIGILLGAHSNTRIEAFRTLTGRRKFNFFMFKASSLVEGITSPKIPGAKSTSFDQWPKSLKNIAVVLAELAE